MRPDNARKAGAVKRDLAALLGDARISDGLPDRVAYSRDLWPRQQLLVRSGDVAPSPPGTVVWPERLEQVRAVVEYARRHGVELVPYGAGSGVCGGFMPGPTAIVMDLKRMRRLHPVDAHGLTVRAEAGIIGQHLEDKLAAQGFTLGHFPSSIHCSTLGGWIAGRSAGQCSGRYGKIEDMVLGLTAVDGRGEVLTLDRDGLGAALLPAVIGSEGTQAIVTEARLRVAPAPRRRVFASYAVPSVERGLEAIRHVYQRGLRPAVCRLYDPFDTWMALRSVGAKRRQAGSMGKRVAERLLRFPGSLNRLMDRVPDRALGGALWILVWELDPEIADAEHSQVATLAREVGAKDLGEMPARHWLSHRHAVGYKQSALFASGAFVDTMEVASSWSHLWPMYQAVRQALAPHAFVMAHFSHPYPDGASIYFTFAGSRADDAGCLRAYERAWQGALEAVVETGGTVSHHHGVGRSKKAALAKELGPAVGVIRAVKRAFDPAGILNPGAVTDGPIRDVTEPTPAGTAARGMEAFLAEMLRLSPSIVQTSETGHSALLPRTVREVQRCVQMAAAHGACLRPPTSPGHHSGALPLQLTRMTQVLELDEESQLVHVECGCSMADLEAALAHHGLSLGLPGTVPEQSVGQWLAGGDGARDPNDDALDHPLAGLEVVLPDGQAAQITPAPRRATGPDLLDLLPRGQGRFGIITSARLTLRPRRPGKTVAFAFPDHARAASARAWMRGVGIRPRATWLGPPNEEAQLVIDIRDPWSSLDAVVSAAHRVAERHAGHAITAPSPWPDPAAALPIADAQSSRMLDAIAAELDPRGTLAG